MPPRGEGEVVFLKWHLWGRPCEEAWISVCASVEFNEMTVRLSILKKLRALPNDCCDESNNNLHAGEQ